MLTRGHGWKRKMAANGLTFAMKLGGRALIRRMCRAMLTVHSLKQRIVCNGHLTLQP